MQNNISMNQATKGVHEGKRIPTDVRALVRWLALESLWFGGGWLFGQAELAFETFPLGIALLCASGNHLLPILAGLILSGVLYMEVPAVYVTVYVAAAAIRLVSGIMLEFSDSDKSWAERMRKLLLSDIRAVSSGQGRESASFWSCRALQNAQKQTAFTDSFWIRISAGAACALILGLYRILANGFLYYDFFATVFSIVITVAATVICYLSQSGNEGNAWLVRASRLAVLFLVVYAAKSVAIMGLPLSPVLALLFVLYVTAREGRVMGCVCAVLAGVAYAPLHVPAYLLAALVCGMMKKEEHGVGVAAVSGLAALTWLVYIEGVGALLVYLPAFLLSGTAYTVAERFFTPKAEKREEGSQTENVRLRMEGSRHQDANERFRGISEAFSSLSEVFYNLSDRFRRPGTLDLRHVCDKTFDKYCTDCPQKAVCWGMEYNDTLSTVNRLTAALHTKGRVSSAEIPPALAHRCEQIAPILESINRDCARLTGEMLRNNRTEIFAMDYEAAASIINDALEEDDGEYRFDTDMEERVFEYLTDAGVRADRVTVYGKRRRQIVVYNVEAGGARVSADTLRDDLGEMCGLLLDNPVFEVEGRIGTMTLRAKRKFSVLGAQNNLSADGGVSGDSIRLLTNRKDYFYALICDGMGAGREAAATSELCSVFLEKMLHAGNRAGTSLRVLNNLVCSRTGNSADECSSTVDLLEFDLMTGECVFIKSGAAPSFVIRGGAVHRLECGSAPIGILNNVEAQSTSFYLQKGDVVVMVSDGVVQDDAECRELTSYLAQACQKTPEELVREISSRALDSERHDDRSVVAIRIGEAKE